MTGNMTGNPLLNRWELPPFSAITAGHVVPAIQALIRQSQAAIDQLAAAPGPRTYENTVLALDRLTEPLDEAMGLVRHLESVRTEPALRSAIHEIEPAVSSFYSSIPLHEGLWAALKAVPDAPPGIHRRFWEKTMRSFRRSGADLEPAQKLRLQEIDVELTRVTTAFSEAVLDATHAWEMLLTEAETAGLPEAARAAARQSALEKGLDGFRITLQAPSYNAVLTYLDDRRIREAAWRAHNTRAADVNRARIVEILALRREKAELLGFPNFADLVLEDRMAQNGARALQFLEDLCQRTAPRFAAEREELARFAGFELQPWDVSYWAEKQRQALYEFDEEELRPYFPLDSVVAGMFAIYSELFGLRIERSEAAGWDPAVECFEIRSADGRRAGVFYTDWFPRENKRGGAWMDCLRTGGPVPGGFEPHLGLMCGNLTPPLGNRPAQLTHREVETIFHEFGHLLHQCLSTVEIRSLAGTRVAWDFVELPSQIMENWCWEQAALDRFARHVETGEPLPSALFEKIKRARNFRAASAQMRQLGLGILDLKLHSSYDASRDGDVLTFARQLLEPLAAAALPADYAMIASFTHLFADPVGYGAGYYSYKWSEALDADAFSRFQREGLFNPQVGGEYRDRILARGDAADPAELYRDFMGRDPDPEALLVRNGLR